MRKLMIKMYLFFILFVLSMQTAYAVLNDSQKAQVLGIVAILIPPIVGAIKKLKIPAVWIPFIPLLLGILIQVILVLTGVVAGGWGLAIAIGLGVGGVGSSVYDAHKAVKTEWNKP